MAPLTGRVASELSEAGAVTGPTGHGWPRSLTRQIRFGLPLFVLLALLLTAGLLLVLSSRVQRDQLVALQAERSRAAATTIEAYLDDIQRKLGYLARVRGLAGQPPELQQRLLEALTRHHDAYEFVALADARGQVGASVAPYDARPPASVAGQPVFLRAFGQGEDFIGPVEVDPASGVPAVILGVPVRDESDEVAGALFAKVNLQYLWFVMAQTPVGETGYTYVVDGSGRVIAGPEGLVGAPSPAESAARPLDRPIGAAGAERPYRGLAGAEVLGGIARVHGVNWYVVAELPTAEAYAPLWRSLALLGAVLAGATLLAVAAGFLFARRVVAPLQSLTGAAERLRAGDLAARVRVAERNELGLLGATFNSMAERLGAVIGELSTSERRFRAIFDQTFQFVGLLAPDGTVLETNRSALEFGGLAPEAVIGRPFWEAGWWCLTPAAQAQVRDAIRRAAEGEFVRFEVEARGAGGAAATVDFSVKPVLDTAGRVVLLIPEGRDITDRKAKEQAERRLLAEQVARAEAENAQRRFAALAEENARLYQEAQQAVRVRNEFLSVASHELKTPLTPLIGQAQLLRRRALRDGTLGERDLRAVEVIAEQATRLNKLIESLLDVARLERGQIELRREPLDVAALARQIGAEIQPTLDNHTLVVAGTDEPLMIAGDRLRLEQVLLNLLTNAVKYSPGGGTITVTVERRAGHALIAVADQGLGIAPEALPHLFERFYRAPNVADGPVTGLGVGLFVVKEILALHGGEISVGSAEGRGSTFTLALPLAG